MLLLSDLYRVRSKLASEMLRTENTTCQDIIAKLACKNLSFQMFALQKLHISQRGDRLEVHLFCFLLPRRSCHRLTIASSRTSKAPIARRHKLLCATWAGRRRPSVHLIIQNNLYCCWPQACKLRFFSFK